MGGIFGFAIGDALGGTTEFMSKEEIANVYGKVTKIIGGGFWNLKPGETTDDTAMTIAVAKGIFENSEDPIESIGKQFLKWWSTNPKDVGITIQTVFRKYKGNWFDAAIEAHFALSERSGGNGSLMRCLPIALAYSDLKKIEEITYLDSKITHYEDIAAETCVIYNRIAYRVLQGENLKEVIQEETKGTIYEDGLFEKPNCEPTGYVVDTMKWVLYWLLTCKTFKDVVVEAANQGGDTDTIAAIAGGLKGIEVGYRKVQGEYLGSLKKWDELLSIGHILFEMRGCNTATLKEKRDDHISDLKSSTKSLIQLVKDNGAKEEQEELMDKIEKAVYLLTVTFEDTQEHNKAWWNVKTRYRRSRRLFELEAPTIIKQHELMWLYTMTCHFDIILKGMRPRFSKDQLDELESLREFEAGFDDEEQ
jgi:ADP-ribosyl-[dinitrogen reductase] hydrolase